MPLHVLRQLSPAVQFQCNSENSALEIQPQNISPQKSKMQNGYADEPINLCAAKHRLETESTSKDCRNVDTLAYNPRLDLKRVNGIKIALDNGFFLVDPYRVANKLYLFEKNLQHTQ